MKKLAIVALGALMVGASLFAQTVPGAGLVKGPEAGEAKNLTGAGATFPRFYTASGSANTTSLPGYR
ncbi:MAG TPA: hypothetical protein PLB48_04790 [Treponema sp.]|nr:hypothetical protein [Treponema sp.]HRS02969.1 hypothetical protein [Treponema sp.]HRU27541.1 hypothetical protein [Treponema sp.]